MILWPDTPWVGVLFVVGVAVALGGSWYRFHRGRR